MTLQDAIAQHVSTVAEFVAKYAEPSDWPPRRDDAERTRLARLRSYQQMPRERTGRAAG